MHEKVEKYRHAADKLLFQYVFNHEIIPRLVKISPVYAALEGCRLEWNERETMTLKEYIEAIKNLAYTFDFDPEAVAEMTGLPITDVKAVTNQGIQSGGNMKNNGKPNNTDDDPNPEPPKPNKKKEPDKPEGSFRAMMNKLYYGDEMGTPHATAVEAAGISLSDKIRDRILNRLRSKGFNVEKDIEPDLFAHTFGKLEEGISKSFGKVEFGTPDHEFLNQMKHNAAVFSAFKTHRQQNEIYSKLFDDKGNMKSFDRFRKDTEQIIQNYNTNWLRTEYDTAVSRARFASDFRRYQADKDVMPNLEWLPSLASQPRDAHRVFYHRIYPLDDPFWRSNYPGNLWNCQCRYRNTDKPATHGKPKEIVNPAKGLGENPGITGNVFTKDHPYIKDADETTKEAVEKFIDHQEGYEQIKTKKGKLRIHQGHGKHEREENIRIGKYFVEKYGYEIDLLDNPQNRKSADSYNRTLGISQEYKLSAKASKNAIDFAIRSAKEQADDIVLWIESNISLEDITAVLRSRVRRSENINSVTIVRNNKDIMLKRGTILADGFKIRPADLK